ncbi:MAG: transposase [Nevskiaceae bacterium]|nr:MAG: transposase [Nevskiaceae bacterium]TBR72641.1 MAG: transposase [Nevskiaceae bacterium]
MARLPRLTVPGLPHHVIQRGAGGGAIFVDDEDRKALLALVAECGQTAGVAVHAWVLLDTEFQLLLTPQSQQSLGHFMQGVTRRYARRFNARHRRLKPLWAGRYRSTVLQPERHFLACMVVMDRLPVAAGMVARAGDYPWSTCRHYCGAASITGLTVAPAYWALGNTPFEREAAYGKRVAAGLGDVRRKALLDATEKGWPLGDVHFTAELQARTGRRTALRRPGRPRGSPPAGKP